MKRFLPILAVFIALHTGMEAHAQNDSTLIIKGVIDTVPHAVYFVLYEQKGIDIRDTVTLDAES